MLGVHKKKNFRVFSRCIQCLWVCMVTQLWSPSNVCVWGVDTRCVHTQSSLSVLPCFAQLFCLHCTLVWLFCHETHLSSTDFVFTWLWLVWTYSPVFTPPEYGQIYQLAQHTNNARTPPYPKYCGHASSLRIPGLYRNQGIDRIKMVDGPDVK